MDFKKQFAVENDTENKIFRFNSVDNNSCSYSVAYHECDADINNAWICVYKAIKRQTNYETSLVRCDLCTHKWVAVRPKDTEKLECPNCENLTNFENIKSNKIKTDFKLTGLSKPQSFTCEPLNNENIFWAKNGLGKEKFNELWDYCNGNWQDKKIAEIEHEGLNEDGTPINPVVVGIRELS